MTVVKKALEGVRSAELASGECPMKSHRKLLSSQTIRNNYYQNRLYVLLNFLIVRFFCQFQDGASLFYRSKF